MAKWPKHRSKFGYGGGAVRSHVFERTPETGLAGLAKIGPVPFVEHCEDIRHDQARDPWLDDRVGEGIDEPRQRHPTFPAEEGRVTGIGFLEIEGDRVRIADDAVRVVRTGTWPPPEKAMMSFSVKRQGTVSTSRPLCARAMRVRQQNGL